MTIDIRHLFVSAKVDSLDTSRVQPSNWNAALVLKLAGGVVVGRAAGAGQAAATELPMGVTGQALIAAASAAAANAITGTDATGATILAAATKTPPVDADSFAIIDSAAGNALKRVTWANIKATLLAYFNAIYAPLASPVFTGNVTAGANFIANGGSFIAGGINTIIASTGTTGAVYLRPQGVGSSTGQMYCNFNGDVVASGNVTGLSDRRLKSNITDFPLDRALEAINGLSPITYEMKETHKKSIGFVAQEVQVHLPELVIEGEEGFLSLAYPNMVAVLWRVVQDQQEKIADLRSRMSALEGHE